MLNIGHKLKETGDPTIEDVISGRTLCAHDFYEGFFYDDFYIFSVIKIKICL